MLDLLCWLYALQLVVVLGLRLDLLVSGMTCVVVGSVPLWCVCLLRGWFWVCIAMCLCFDYWLIMVVCGYLWFGWQ